MYFLVSSGYLSGKEYISHLNTLSIAFFLYLHYHRTQEQQLLKISIDSGNTEVQLQILKMTFSCCCHWTNIISAYYYDKTKKSEFFAKIISSNSKTDKLVRCSDFLFF